MICILVKDSWKYILYLLSQDVKGSARDVRCSFRIQYSYKNISISQFLMQDRDRETAKGIYPFTTFLETAVQNTMYERCISK
ncbi:hypothetical protein ACET3Z_003764 [Daucus carota]